MKEYDFEGTIDSDGTMHGTLTERPSGGDAISGVIFFITIYILSLIGGIIVISNVAKDAPFCIVPAVLSYIILLIPIIIATKSGSFFLTILKVFYKFANLLIALLVVMFWILYISEALSNGALMGIGFALMYLTVVSVIKTFKKSGTIGGVITIVVPGILYLIILALSHEASVAFFAIIPTTSTVLSLFISEINNIYDFNEKCFRKKLAFPIIKILFYVISITAIFLFNSYTVNHKASLLQLSKDYINENKYSEARSILQDIKLDEAKELYYSIRYKDVKIGEIIYNGYYEKSDNRCVSEDGIAFICLDIVDGKALLISEDVLFLNEQGTPLLDEAYLDYLFSFNVDGIEPIVIDESQSKFFLLSKDQFDLYVQNDVLSPYLKSCNVSDFAIKQKEDVDSDNYQWTIAYTDFWLLNDFKSGPYIGTINTQTGEHNYQFNLKVYAGIRPCYWVNVE